MNNPGHYFPNGSYLLGDSAYPSSANLITPFPESECLRDPRKRLFNYSHSARRMAIERTFGQFVHRWRFTQFHIYVYDQLDINDIIGSCAILHNTCKARGELGFDGVVLEPAGLVVGEQGDTSAIGNSARMRIFNAAFL